MSHVRLAAIVAGFIGVAVITGCRSAGPPPVIDSALASCVPPGTVALAGIDLDQLRSKAIYRSMPQSTLGSIEILRDASYLLIASNGKDLLVIARGKFRAAPAGATLLSPSLAIAGPAETIRAAGKQHKTGVTGAPRILEWAAGIASGKPVWAAAQGGITLPLTGNAANLNRILHFTEYLTLAAQIDLRVQVDFTGVCPTADASRQLEESLRALLTFSTIGSDRKSDLTPILKSIEIRRDDLKVHATLSASQESAAKLLGELVR